MGGCPQRESNCFMSVLAASAPHLGPFELAGLHPDLSLILATLCAPTHAFSTDPPLSLFFFMRVMLRTHGVISVPPCASQHFNTLGGRRGGRGD